LHIEIRRAELDDIDEIVEVYCSGVSEWFRTVGGRRVKATYKDLSVWERFLHGGPWMSIETLSVHINYLLVYGQYPLVAIADGRIVGELELYIGVEKGSVGMHGFIDVLEVHASYRRRGIGRALVNEAYRIAKEHGCEKLVVWPTREAIGFYEKCGFREQLFRVVAVELECATSSSAEQSRLKPFPGNYDLLADMVFVSPRILTSYTAWLKDKFVYAVELGRVEWIRGCLREGRTCFVIETMPMDRSAGKLYLWVSDTRELRGALEDVITLALSRGVYKLKLLVDEELLPLIESAVQRYRVVGREVVLARKIE